MSGRLYAYLIAIAFYRLSQALRAVTILVLIGRSKAQFVLAIWYSIVRHVTKSFWQVTRLRPVSIGFLPIRWAYASVTVPRIRPSPRPFSPCPMRIVCVVSACVVIIMILLLIIGRPCSTLAPNRHQRPPTNGCTSFAIVSLVMVMAVKRRTVQCGHRQTIWAISTW